MTKPLIPGSPEARAQGCTCPHQNRNHAYIVSRSCTLHYRKHDSDDVVERHGWRSKLPEWMPGHEDYVPRRAYMFESSYRKELGDYAYNSIDTTPTVIPPPYIYHDEVSSPAHPDSPYYNPTAHLDQSDQTSPFTLPEIHFPSPSDLSNSLTDTLNSASDAMSHLGDSLPIGSGGGSGGFDSSPVDTSSFSSSVDTSSNYSVDTSSSTFDSSSPSFYSN